MPAQILLDNRLPLGVPGDLTRDARECTVEAAVINPALPPTLYGVPVKWVTAGAVSTMTPIAAGDAAAAVAGFNVRSNPSMGGSLVNQGFGQNTPPVSGVGDLLRRGYICVKPNGVVTGIVKKTPVLMRVGTPTQQKPIGGVEAVSDGANTVQIVGAFFTGPVDNEGNAEIEFNI